MKQWAIALTIGLLLISNLACSTAKEYSATPRSTSPSIMNTPPAASTEPPEFLPRLQEFVAQQAGLDPTQLTLQQSEVVQWSDACLGAARPDEFCAQVITPGYRITFSTGQRTYEVHTDQTGRAMRMAQKISP
jgi:hypothetical protein